MKIIFPRIPRPWFPGIKIVLSNPYLIVALYFYFFIKVIFIGNSQTFWPLIEKILPKNIHMSQIERFFFTQQNKNHTYYRNLIIVFFIKSADITYLRQVTVDSTLEIIAIDVIWRYSFEIIFTQVSRFYTSMFRNRTVMELRPLQHLGTMKDIQSCAIWQLGHILFTLIQVQVIIMLTCKTQETKKRRDWQGKRGWTRDKSWMNGMAP